MNRWLRDYPIFAAALGSRDMTMSHLRYIKNHLVSHRSFDALRDDQQFFADAARDCDFAGFKQVCGYWLNAIDPDGEEPKDQLKNCGLTMRKGRGGRGRIEIDIDAVSFVAVKTAINHQLNKTRAAQTDESMPDSAFAGRGLAQQRLSALLQLIARGHQRDDGTTPTPLINLVMSQTVAEWAHNQIHGLNTTKAAESAPVHPNTMSTAAANSSTAPPSTPYSPSPSVDSGTSTPQPCADTS